VSASRDAGFFFGGKSLPGIVVPRDTYHDFAFGVLKFIFR
jgi:hypothetical protein